MTLRYMYTVSITTLCLLSLVFYHCVADIGHWMAANRLQMNPTKTELLWAGSKHITMLGSCAAALQLGSDTVTASYHVRVLGVTISSDFALEKHVSKTCAATFLQFRAVFTLCFCILTFFCFILWTFSILKKSLGLTENSIKNLEKHFWSHHRNEFIGHMQISVLWYSLLSWSSAIWPRGWIEIE